MPAEYWVDAWFGCHNLVENGISQWCWPDGKPYAEQQKLTIEIFNIIQNEVTQYLKEKARNR